MAGNIDTVALVNPDGSRIATVRDTGSNDSLNVAIVDASGNQITSFGSAPTSGTGTASTASVTSASTTVLASNANRLGATMWNEGSAVCYLKLGATASTTTYTVQLNVGDYFEVPAKYTGIVTGITSSGTATVRVTELT